MASRIAVSCPHARIPRPLLISVCPYLIRYANAYPHTLLKSHTPAYAHTAYATHIAHPHTLLKSHTEAHLTRIPHTSCVSHIVHIAYTKAHLKEGGCECIPAANCAYVLPVSAYLRPCETPALKQAVDHTCACSSADFACPCPVAACVCVCGAKTPESFSDICDTSRNPPFPRRLLRNWAS